MPLGTEVGLGPSDVVLDGDPAPPKWGTAPIFGPCLLWPNGWMDQDATWYEGGPRGPCHIVLDGEPSPPKAAQQFPPLFGTCQLWPRSPISATAELLYRRSPKHSEF